MNYENQDFSDKIKNRRMGAVIVSVTCMVFWGAVAFALVG